jgi:hypothetical protein
MNTPKPVLQALLLAEHVYQDRATGKKIIAGTFNRLNFTRRRPQSPASAPPEDAEPFAEPPAEEPIGQPEARELHNVISPGSPFAFITLTEVHGTIPLELRYVDLQNNSVLLTTRFQVSCDDPLNTMELTIPIPMLPAPHEGVYALELLHGNEPLGSMRIVAVENPQS